MWSRTIFPSHASWGLGENSTCATIGSAQTNQWLCLESSSAILKGMARLLWPMHNWETNNLDIPFPSHKKVLERPEGRHPSSSPTPQLVKVIGQWCWCRDGRRYTAKPHRPHPPLLHQWRWTLQVCVYNIMWCDLFTSADHLYVLISI